MKAESAQPLWSPLRNRTFRSVFVASQVSTLGWMMQGVALSWVMATISKSEIMVALVQSISTLPMFCLAVFAGAIADNYSRRAVLIVGRCLMMAAASMLAILMMFQVTNPWLILALTFLDGCGVALSDPAWSASFGDLLERRFIAAAVTLQNVGFNTMRSIGPALGGLVIDLSGPLIVFVITALGFLAPLAALSRNDWQAQPSSLPREPLMTSIYDGFRFTAISAEIKSTIARGTMFGFAGTSVLALLPLVVRDELKAGPMSFGIVMAGFGAGAFLAGMMNPTFRKWLTQELLVKFACLSCGASALALAHNTSLLVATISAATAGAGWVTMWAGLGINVQLASPRWIVGRTISIYSAFTYGGITAGSWFWGFVAQTHSLATALVWSGASAILVAGVGLKFPISNRSESELEPSGDFDVPSAAFDLTPRSGPILVTREYRVPGEVVSAFIELMHRRRLYQSRIGARHWTLMRDVQDAARWVETFRTPTWADFQRIHHRLTSADKELDGEIRNLLLADQYVQASVLIERPTAGGRRPYLLLPFVGQK